MNKQCILLSIIVILLLITNQEVDACSGYKITIGDKTILGSNEDAWRTTPHVWFEVANTTNKYGAAFTGSRFDGKNGYAPQSGMNETGLAFERLAAYHPVSSNKTKGIQINNATAHLKNILHQCQTVEEVQSYINKFDYSLFIEDIFFYVDKNGKYLIVEPYCNFIGNDQTYVVSNFCPSITPTESALKINRYRKGINQLKKNIDTSDIFCKELSDSMHVCRNKIGDGTLLTSIWDLKNKKITLYFYHNYQSKVEFILSKELTKGNHILAIDCLFPKNIEFLKLKHYHTAKNSIPIATTLIILCILLLVCSIYLLKQVTKNDIHLKQKAVHALLAVFNLLQCCYLYFLFTNVNVYYFPAPYKTENILYSLLAYIPNLMLFAILPILYFILSIIRHATNKLKKVIFSINIICYSILLGLYYYWYLFAF